MWRSTSAADAFFVGMLTTPIESGNSARSAPIAVVLPMPGGPVKLAMRERSCVVRIRVSMFFATLVGRQVERSLACIVFSPKAFGLAILAQLLLLRLCQFLGLALIGADPGTGEGPRLIAHR